MKTGAIYARYSPGKGREKSTTIEAQMAMCRQMATQDQVWIDDSHIYIDRGISGGNIDRPNFQRMLENSSKVISLTISTSRTINDSSATN